MIEIPLMLFALWFLWRCVAGRGDGPELPRPRTPDFQALPPQKPGPRRSTWDPPNEWD